MSGAETETGITREEFDEMKKGMVNIQRAMEELKRAQTPTEKREAREDVESAERALERYAQAHGISVSDAEDAIAQVKRNSQKADMRSILQEIFEEDEAAAAAEAQRAADEKKAGKKESVTKAREVKPNEDTEPVEPHWTDKRVFG